MGRNKHKGDDKKRGRVWRRDFGKAENVWKKPRRDNGQGENNGNGVWRDGFVLENKGFEEYYKKQGICPEAEWDSFMAILKKPLPTTFRINGSGKFAFHIRDLMQEDGFGLIPEEVDDEKVERPRCLPWYPNNLAWHLSFGRNQLRKNNVLEQIHEFLKRENESGNITRQEAVSMVPPLFLDVQPHHKVLDMCAAPGSKTFQLLEALHQGDLSTVPAGMVIANDVNLQRCHLLVHQTKRMCSPNILITNHEAQLFPLLKEPSSSATDGSEAEGLLFDRILCDVPCSGDGTVRKAPDIWRKWSTGQGNGLHRLQLAIAMRGVALLKVGGLMVYSTCSLNPIEDEAVVAQILRQSNGCMELVDLHDQMPELKRRPGLKSWLVKDKKRFLASFTQVNPAHNSGIHASMFPAGSETTQNARLKTAPPAPSSEEGGEEQAQPEVCDLPLERTIRILPHMQDTGGFYVALLRKVAPFEESREPTRHRTQGALSLKAADSKAKPAPEAPVKSELEGDWVVVQADEAKAASGDVAQPPADVAEASVEVSGTGADVAQGNADEAEDVADVAEDVAEEAEDFADVAEADAEALADVAGAGPDLDDTGADVADDEDADVAEGDAAEGPGEAKEDPPKGRQHARQGGSGVGPRGGPRKVQQQGQWFGVDPVICLRDKDVLDSIREYYGIKEGFPLNTQLITRSDNFAGVKRIYFVSRSILEVIELNLKLKNPLKMTSVGIKLFERQSVKDPAITCALRIVLEGLPVILPYLTKQLVLPSVKDFRTMLTRRALPLNGFEDPALCKALEGCQQGCVVMALRRKATTEEGSAQEVDTLPIGIVCWKGKGTVNVLVNKVEAASILERLGVEEGDPVPGEVPKEEVPATGAQAGASAEPLKEEFASEVTEQAAP